MPVLNETDVYREFAAPARLRRSIACLWIRRGGGAPVRVLPDACTDIVWRAGAGAIVAGPDTRAWVSHPMAGETIVGVRLLPGAGGSVLKWPLAELRDQRVALTELGLSLGEQLDTSLDPARAFRSVAAVAFRLAEESAADAAVQAAVVRLRAPTQRVEPLADELGLSERQLRRRFLAAVGYGPKTLQRVLRLQRFIARAGAGDGGEPATLAGTAFAAGYADQPHLVRECRALTGLTPRQLVDPAATASERSQPPAR
jgi:AraC-like DNA-binding protein